MADTIPVFARIDRDLKEDAEEILAELGITPTSAIRMFYRQIVMRRGLPFELRMPPKHPLDMSNMTEEELMAEIRKGLDAIEQGDTFTAEEVEAELRKELKDRQL